MYYSNMTQNFKYRLLLENVEIFAEICPESMNICTTISQYFEIWEKTLLFNLYFIAYTYQIRYIIVV